jgi:hypothetical protein
MITFVTVSSSGIKVNSKAKNADMKPVKIPSAKMIKKTIAEALNAEETALIIAGMFIFCSLNF